MWSIIIIILIQYPNNSESNKGGIITISSFFSPHFEAILKKKSFPAILGTCIEGFCLQFIETVYKEYHFE